jgi:uncharacterized membrane protein YkvA (DUF1232 family)
MNSRNPRSTPAGWSWTNLLRDAVATWRLLWDPSVPGMLKLALPFMALIYLLSPLDLIPLMPLDDIAVVMLAARLFVALSPRDSVNRAFNGSAAPNMPRNETRRQDDSDVIDTTWRVIE